ncbi:hypothetical protein OQA88_3995 [Cercophora sp. LCS_1]
MKVAIVIDSSGSMSSSDPSDLRLCGIKADQVVAIAGFDGTSYTVFEPADPADPMVNEAISGIEASGGTFIARGVYEAIDKIAAMSGTTKDRFAIVVYTDGSDSDTGELVDGINNATSLGIRVSFDFLDDRASAQSEEVLLAIRNSKGVYTTITTNPQGAGDRLLAGLASMQFISDSSPVTMKYLAEKGETALASFTGDTLNVEAPMGGQTLDSTDSNAGSSSRTIMHVMSSNSGELEIVVRASNSPTDGLFSVVTGSTTPIKNCTVGVTGNNTGLSTGGKAGIGVGVVAAVLGLAGAGFAAYKHLLAGGNTAATPVGSATTAPTMGYGETTGGEKPDPQVTIHSIPPNHADGGSEGNLTGQTGGGPPSAPHTGGPPFLTPPAVPTPFGAVQPFVPPVVHPMNPNHKGGNTTPAQTDYQQPHIPGDQYQQPLDGSKGYQSPSHAGTYSQGNSTNYMAPPTNSDATYRNSGLSHTGVRQCQ